MSIATVVTRGYGAFGTIGKVVTAGYSSNAAVVVAGPYVVADVAVFTPGAQPGETRNVFIPGIQDAAVFTPGATDREVTQWQT